MEGKCSLIFLYDSGKTLRWRLGPALLRSLILLTVLLPLVTAGSLWLNWKLFETRRSTLAENTALRHELETNAQTVARLASLEQFLSQADPENLGNLVAVAPESGSTSPGATSAADEASFPANSASPSPGLAPGVGDPTKSSGGASAASSDSAVPGNTDKVETGSDVTAGVMNTDPDAPDDSASPAGHGVTDDAAVPSAEVVSESPNTDESTAAEPETSGNQPVNTGLARVENMTARRVGARSLRISFDLFNTEQVPQLAGHTSFTLVLKDGRAVPLAAHGDTTYRINRLKKIVGNPTLPAEINDTEGASVQVSIFADKDLIYRVTTPLQQ